MPAAETQILDAGHFAFGEQPAAIADLTRGFLGRPIQKDPCRNSSGVSRALGAVTGPSPGLPRDAPACSGSLAGA